jgi:hypothetical protein
MSEHHSKKSKKKNDKKSKRDEDTDDAIVEEYGENKENKENKERRKKSTSKSGSKHRKPKDESESEEEEEEPIVSDKFRRAVISYIKYDNRSRDLRELQTALNKKKKELSEVIIGKMDDTNMKTVTITGGKLHRNKADTQAPLKQDMILKTLKKELGRHKAAELMEKIQAQRPMTTRINLKRVKERKDAPSSSQKKKSSSHK